LGLCGGIKYIHHCIDRRKCIFTPVVQTLPVAPAIEGGDFRSHLELEGDRTSVTVRDEVNGHVHFHFSVTIQSEEFFIISAMRGLTRQCQPEINHQIAAAGASKAQWKRQHGVVTFYFTGASNRKDFLKESSLLFSTGWKEISQDHKKTAPRQS
jgi:hypothetical protein